MLVGTVGLAAASSLGPAMLSARKFAAPIGAPTGLRSASPVMSGADALSTLPEALKIDPDDALEKFGSDFCSRRNALGRAAAAAAAMIGAPALVSAAAQVTAGGEGGGLGFIPSEITICAGDTVTWTNGKGGPHNVVFNENKCPEDFDADAASMDKYMSNVGDSYSFKFDVAGSYGYVCSPHQGSGMKGTVIVQ